MHGDEASDHGDMFGAPVRVDVIEELVAPRAANIDVDVRAIPALFVQKSFEVQPPAQRTDAGNAQAIRHDGACRRPARHRGNAAAPCFLHDVPYQQKIRRQAQLFDRSEEHTSELQSRLHLVCRLLLEKKKPYENSSYILRYTVSLAQ